MNRHSWLLLQPKVLYTLNCIKCLSWEGIHDWCLAGELLWVTSRLRYFSDSNISMIQYIFWKVNIIFEDGCFRWENGLFYCKNDDIGHRFVRMWGEKKWTNRSHVLNVWTWDVRYTVCSASEWTKDTRICSATMCHYLPHIKTRTTKWKLHSPKKDELVHLFFRPALFSVKCELTRKKKRIWNSMKSGSNISTWAVGTCP